MSLVKGSDYMALERETGTWIIQDLIPQSGLLNVYGAPKKGKSFLTLQIAHAIANPKETFLLNFPVIRHGPVAYLQIDTPRYVWMDRLSDLARARMDFSDVWFADSQIAPYPFNIQGEGGQWLALACKEVQPVLVIVDTLRESHGGDENDSGHMRNVINAFATAVGGAAILFVSHARKNNGDDSSLMGDQRGSSYLVGRMDCVLRVGDTSIQYQGRAVGEERVKIRRDPITYCLEVADDFEIAARDLVERTPSTSVRELTRQLQAAFPKRSFDGIRSAVRRLATRSGGPDRVIMLD